MFLTVDSLLLMLLFKKLQEQIKVLEGELYLVSLQTEDNQVPTDTVIKNLENQLSTLNGQINKITDLQKDLKEANSKLKQLKSLQKESGKLVGILNDVNNKINKLDSDNTTINEDIIEKISESSALTNKKIETTQKDFSDMKKIESTKDIKLANLVKQLKTLSELTASKKSLRTKINTKKDTIQEQISDIIQIRENQKQLDDKQKELTIENNDLKIQNTTLKKQFEILKQEQATSIKDTHLEAQNRELEIANANLKAENANQLEEKKLLEDRINQLMNELALANKKADVVEEATQPPAIETSPLNVSIFEEAKNGAKKTVTLGGKTFIIG